MPFAIKRRLDALNKATTLLEVKRILKEILEDFEAYEAKRIKKNEDKKRQDEQRWRDDEFLKARFRKYAAEKSPPGFVVLEAFEYANSKTSAFFYATQRHPNHLIIVASVEGNAVPGSYGLFPRWNIYGKDIGEKAYKTVEAIEGAGVILTPAGEAAIRSMKKSLMVAVRG